MYGIYANIWGILMGSMLPYIAYMDPMRIGLKPIIVNASKLQQRCAGIDSLELCDHPPCSFELECYWYLLVHTNTAATNSIKQPQY